MNVDTPSPYRLRGIWSGTDDMALQGRRQTRPVFPIAVADHSHRTARTGVHTCLPARYGPHRAMSARPVPTFISMTERLAAGEDARDGPDCGGEVVVCDARRRIGDRSLRWPLPSGQPTEFRAGELSVLVVTGVPVAGSGRSGGRPPRRSRRGSADSVTTASRG